MKLQMRDGTYDAKSVPALQAIQQQLQQTEQEMAEAVEQVRQLADSERPACAAWCMVHLWWLRQVWHRTALTAQRSMAPFKSRL
jgi:hypothetical protein